MNTNLSQFNENCNNMIELVICNNDGMAEGVISALNDIIQFYISVIILLYMADME